MSNGQLHKLARLAAGRKDDPTPASASTNGSGNLHAEGLMLEMDDFRNTADLAYEAVDVSDTVIDILTGLRNYLQVSPDPDRPCMQYLLVLDKHRHLQTNQGAAGICSGRGSQTT